jgi:hypothetical protein
MASEYLSVPEDIDGRITEFVRGRHGVTVEMVLRDITRIATIVKLVKDGWLDGKNAVLCGGMAMRCLESPRFTIFDTDTSSIHEPDRYALSRAIETDDDDLLVQPAAPEQWKDGKDLVTAQPIDYEPRFSTLNAGRATFTLSVTWRGLERKAVWETMKLGYPFPVLPDPDMKIPIMAPNEMLAEKLCAWWINGLAKQYHDVAFLGGRLENLGELTTPETRADLLELIDVKLNGNRSVSSRNREAVGRLNGPRRIGLLRSPERHIEPGKGFDTLSFLFGESPSVAEMAKTVDKTIIRPILEPAR